MFDWQSTSCSNWEVALKTCQQKAEQGETIGITLAWQGTSVGGEFLIDQDSQVTFNLTVNRMKLVEDLSFTDFNWYLPKLILALDGSRHMIRTIQCLDTY